MKDEIRFQKKLFSLVSKTSVFYLLILASFLVAGFIGILLSISYSSFIDNFYEMTIAIFSSSNYFLVLLFIFLLNTIYIYFLFGRDPSFQLRCQNKKDHIKKLMITTWFFNSILFLLNLLFLMILINLFGSVNYSITNTEHGVVNIVYFLWYMFRTYFWIQIISTLNILLFKKLSLWVVTIFNCIYLIFVLFLASLPVDYIIRSISDIGIHISYFFLSAQYGSFLFEIAISVLYGLLAILLIKGIWLLLDYLKSEKFTLRLKFTVAVIKNDVRTLVTNLRKPLIVYLVALLCLLYWVFINKDVVLQLDDFKNIFGLSYHIGDEILELIFMLLTLVFYVYLAIYLFCKDIDLQMGNLFLRILPAKFLSSKMISIASLTLVVKGASYLFIYLFFSFLSRVSFIEVLSLFGKDFLFTLTIEFILLLCLFIYYSLKKYGWLLWIVALLLLRLVIIPIDELKLFVWLMILIVVITLLLVMFNRYAKVIFERIKNGG